MADLVQALVQGFPIGCVYALIALGFVLTYKTSGIFNLAFGAQAFTSAAVYYELAVRREWNIALALLVAVGLVAPAIGLVLDRALFRHLRNAPPVARLVSSLGLLIAIPSIVKILMDFDREPTFGAIGIVPDGGTIYGQGHIYAVTRDEVATIAVTFLAAAFLMVLFRYTALGLRMRAVVESPRMTELAGVNADRVSAFAWALSSLFAGLSGVLLAPRFANVNETNFFELVVVAIAAAAFAGLTSLPRALLGGLLLGVAQQVLAIFLPTNSLLAQGLRPSLPFVVLFLVIVLWRGLRKAGAITDPLAGVNPPPPGRATDIRGPGLTIATYVFGIVAAVAFWNFYVAGDAFWLLVTTEWIIYSVIFLSITVITGMAGQISLAQATFAAIGAFTTMQVTDRFGASVLLSMVIGAVVAAAVGGLLSLPVLRLGGIWLALATLAFALFFNAVLVKFDWIGGGIPQPRVPRPVIGPFDFASDKSFLVLCIVILAIVAFLVLQVREGTTGKFLSALRGSEVAAESVGIDPARARITAFALSAGIAGLGGGLLAIRQGAVNYEQNYTVFVGLFWVVIVVTLGTRVIDGAIQAGFGFKVFPELVLKSWLGLSQAWHFVLFGFGAITFARHPEGVLEFNKRKSLNFFQRQLDKLMGRETGDDTAGGSRPGTPPATSEPEPRSGDGAARLVGTDDEPVSVATDEERDT